ncbi:hypothetical protein TWF788_002172 [Orbilia oligospora]|uniref:ARS binding protein 2 n=1 Tax=Orbilia oligospora TaxID=2813651 RepID=A0A7C8PBQ4_ORBOL|nr:hypothetical protein TWF788_002172 [Orbilia oligospora]
MSSRDAQPGDDGAYHMHRHRLDSSLSFPSVSIRDLDNPEPNIRHFLGPPVSSIRRLSFPSDDEEEDHETRRQLVTEITREATGLVDDVQNDTTAATHMPVEVAVIRRWPTRDVTDDKIHDCYVDFILCCNPAVPDNCDTAELRKSFRAPPKSDGVTFSVFKLFQLIKRFEEGDIKTWIQLVTELGVERKQDQSTQKVQQYAVRLKRWMHAMHVDAFFEYCLGRPHGYYTDIPLSLPTLDDEVRDGVPLEEDLALRALLPEYRPKRGRRKVERNSIDSNYMSISEKRHKQPLLPATLPNILSPEEPSLLNYEESHVSSSLQKEDRIRDLDPLQPDARLWPELRIHNSQPLFHSIFSNPFDTLHPVVPGGQPLRWHTPPKPFDLSHRSGGPHERIRSVPVQQFPTLKRARRNHRLTVSSAWPSFGTSRGGKSRGRPTGNRGAAETLYTTFPASPASLEVQLSDQGINVPLGPELSSTPTAIDEQLQFGSKAHQTILPPIIHPLEDPAYDHNVEIPPLLEREISFDPYSVLGRGEMIKEQLATHLLTAPQDDMTVGLARSLADSLVDGVMQENNDRVIGTTLRPLSMLLGLDALDMHDLVITKDSPISEVERLEKEISLFERYRATDPEEQSLHDLINTDDSPTSPQTIAATNDQENRAPINVNLEGEYQLSWKLKLGSVVASVSTSVTLANKPQQAVEEEQRLPDEFEVDMLLSDMETGNPSPGSFPGSTSDLLLNDDIEPPLDDSIDWRARYFEAREKLRKVEEELERLKHDLIARVMS